jgi:N-acetylmuramoyl-L-alanine amidase
LGWSLLRGEATRPRWPDPAAKLTVAPLEPPLGVGVRRIFLDAGHGAPGNAGNSSAYCELEQDFTASLARDVARSLEQSGHFAVRLSRSGSELVPYAERVRAAEQWHADAFVSLHSDVRGRPERWVPAPDQQTCLKNHDAPGFSVLWSDDAEDALRKQRERLARGIARQLEASGMLPYRGQEYHADYGSDAGHAGVFVDRHGRENRIFVLWRPKIPSVIIETHNARDDREVLRFREPATRRAFAAALARALVRTLSPAGNG